ncbi:MAG: ABC transporter substrate-binding protein [Alistipes sp.]|nr:ABC transporter substrate-binding protein [Candidatus Alistipes equi]
MKKAFFLFFIAILWSSCSQPIEEMHPIEEYKPEWAEGFTLGHDSLSHKKIMVIKDHIEGENSHKQIIIFDSINQSKSLGNGLFVIHVPVKKVALMSTSFAAMLSKTGFENCIVGMSGTQFLLEPKVRERIDNGECVEIGNESNLDLEKMKAIGTDLVLLNGMRTDNSRLEKKLQQIGIPYIYIGDYIESTPLGKCEWVVALSEIMGDRQKGIYLFSQIRDRYLQLKSIQFQNRPKVMVNTPYRDVWFMPGKKNYMARLIEDAGAEYIFTENTGLESVPISMEEALRLTSECDYWINVGQYTSLKKLCEDMPLFCNLKVVRLRHIYNNNRLRTSLGGSAFWESGCMEPDLILQDLLTIFHPEISSKELKYYSCLE